MDHLAKLAAYVPGPVRNAVDDRHSSPRLSRDPVYQIFGLDSPEYAAATLAGGTIPASIAVGDIYQECVESVFMTTLG